MSGKELAGFIMGPQQRPENDPAVVQRILDAMRQYEKEMEEEVIPAIIADMKERARLAKEARNWVI